MLMHAQFNFASDTQTTIGQLIDNLNIATTTFAWISVAAGAFSAGCGIAAMRYQEEANQLPDGWETALTAFVSVYSLGTCIWILIELSSAVVVTVTLSSWAFAVSSGAVAIAIAILDTFNTIND